MNALFATTAVAKEGTGGGIVSLHEARALETYAGGVDLVDRNSWEQQSNNPFDFDMKVSQNITKKYDVVHFNGNPWIETVKTLRYYNPDVKIVSSVPAHNLQKSIAEHLRLGIPHNELYPHLHIPELWRKYIEHINQSDMVIVPSYMSKDWLYNLPYIRRDLKVKVIRHGVDIPDKIPPFPDTFTPAYFGAHGADKGTHLLPKDMKKFGRAFGNDYDNLYDLMSQISIGVFPSISEAFNICALESMAYGRPVALSDSLGVAELIPTLSGIGYPTNIIKLLEDEKTFMHYSKVCRQIAEQHTWEIIEKQYLEAYNEM